MFLDIGRNRTLLPGSEAAPSGRSDAWGPGVETHEFMRQDGAESFEIRAAIGACTLDQPLELGRRVPQCGVLEEQPRREERRRGACLRMRWHLGRIEIEMHNAG